MPPWRWAWIGVAVGVCWLAGCGGGQKDDGLRLAGKVTLRGQPVPSDADARIRFMPTTGGQGQPVEVKILNSQYRAEKVPKGKLMVLFYISRQTGRLLLDHQSPDAYPKEEIRENLVPERYRQGIPMEIATDNLQLDFDLK